MQQVLLLVLAIVFSIALMFSFTELPRLLDLALAQNVEFPGLDHGRNEISAYKAEQYISGLHLRWIGYGSLVLVFIFIILGFTTKKSSWAWAGAFVIFLPVFGQFALSMFFLAGLGMLRVGWLPFWDLSFQVLDMGNVVLIPYWILMWIFRQFGYWAQLEISWFLMGSGAFLFTWGVLNWIQSRFGKQGVANAWIYKFSRHPQYLGWIIWSYGLIIYTPLINQMKKSWGISSSLPWLLMFMIIIGICMLEELHMKNKYGKEYEAYRDRTPFLFPIPAIIKKMIKFPMWILIRKKRPEKKKEVVSVITLYTILFVTVSLIWVDLGQSRVFPITESRREAEVLSLVEEINFTQMRRTRWFLFQDLQKYGDAAVAPMINFLSSVNPEDQEFAAQLLGDMGDTSAIIPLYGLLDHDWENVRTSAIRAIVKLGDRKIIPVLMEMLPYERSNYPRVVIYESFGDLKAKEAWNLLVQAKNEQEDWVKMAAVRSMAKIDPKGTTPYLLPLFTSESAWVRGDAAAIAIRLNDVQTLPYLESMLNDEDFEVRFFASRAIKSIKN